MGAWCEACEGGGKREVQGLWGKGGGGIVYRDEEAQGGRVRQDPH